MLGHLGLVLAFLSILSCDSSSDPPGDASLDSGGDTGGRDATGGDASGDAGGDAVPGDGSAGGMCGNEMCNSVQQCCQVCGDVGYQCMTNTVECPGMVCGEPMCGEEFPAFNAGCTGDTDCRPVSHQVDCCGTIKVLAVVEAQSAQFIANETACRDEFDECDCAPMQTTTEDGKNVSSLGEAQVRCDMGTCESFALN